MKELILLSLILLSIWLCAFFPSTPKYPISEHQLSQLDYPQAIADWKCSDGQTDECSSPAPIHWIGTYFIGRDWFDCCKQHDFDYNFGYKYAITKDQADYALWECVKSSNHPIIANIIYNGVHVFGNQFYHTGEQ